ncbi:MAG TPA: hypothetical protein PKC89_12470 [Pyrinomonadaceae bacterium]|nr:hypothetical protein [Pyrinomonadaceae bacterium]
MDDVTRNRIDAFDRCEQWFAYNAAGVNTIGKLKNLALEVKTKLTTLDDTAGALVVSLTDNLMQLQRTAGYIIENAFESDVAALASWKFASHVEVPPKKKAPPRP